MCKNNTEEYHLIKHLMFPLFDVGLEHFYKGQKTPSNTHLHLAFIFSGKRCDQPFFLGQMTLQWSGIYWLRLQLAVMEICHPG